MQSFKILTILHLASNLDGNETNNNINLSQKNLETRSDYIVRKIPKTSKFQTDTKGAAAKFFSSCRGPIEYVAICRSPPHII